MYTQSTLNTWSMPGLGDLAPVTALAHGFVHIHIYTCPISAVVVTLFRAAPGSDEEIHSLRPCPNSSCVRGFSL